MKLFEMFDGMKGHKKLKENAERLAKLKARTGMSEADLDQAVKEATIDEAGGLEGIARKFIPGYGKCKAKNRADDCGFSGHLDSKYADYHGDEDAARNARIAFKAQKKYKKIAGESADINEAVSATDYNPSSQGGTRKELLAKLAKSKNAKDAESARKAGASQDELKKAFDEAVSATDYNPSSQGGTRKELLSKFAKTKDNQDATNARKAGASQAELKKALDEDEALQIGDKVHLGFGAKGGAGFEGVISNIDEYNVWIKHENGNTYKGPIKNVSKMDANVGEGWGAEGQKRDMQAMLSAKDAMLKKYADNPKMVALLKGYMSKGWNAAAAEKEALSKVNEGYKILPPIDDRYQERQGLEGPFRTNSGKVLYYDPREGRYYDPDSDMYLSHDEYDAYDAPNNKMDEAAESGEPRHFAHLVKAYNDAAFREHKWHMTNRQGKQYNAALQKLKAIESEIYKHYGNLADAQGNRLKDVGIESYDTADPMVFVNSMMGSSMHEGSGPKEKQRSKYVDRNSPEAKAKVSSALDKMARDEKAAAGKDLLNKINKKTEEGIGDWDVSGKSAGKRGDGIDPSDKVIVQHISGGKKYYYKRGSEAYKRVLQNIRKGAPYHVVSDDYKDITDEDMAQALKFAQADSKKARNPKAKKFGPGVPQKKKDNKQSAMPDVYFAMEDLTEAPNASPNQLQQEAASATGFEFDGTVFVRTRKATQEKAGTEVALHAVNPESGEHAMVFDDGGIVRSSSIDELTGEGWIAQGEKLGEAWPTQYVEKKVNLKNLARMIDNGKDPSEIKGLESAAASLGMSTQELVDLACNKYLDASDYNDYADQRNLREYLERINESIANFQIDDPAGPEPTSFDWTGSPEWSGKAKTHGITKGGTSARAEIGGTKSSTDLQNAWRNLLPKLKRVSHSPAMQKKVVDTLTKLADVAKKNGVELTPEPGSILPKLAGHKTLGL